MLTVDDYLCIPKDYFQWLAFQSSKAAQAHNPDLVFVG